MYYSDFFVKILCMPYGPNDAYKPLSVVLTLPLTGSGVFPSSIGVPFLDGDRADPVRAEHRCP
jgi:hypothetical protein